MFLRSPKLWVLTIELGSSRSARILKGYFSDLHRRICLCRRKMLRFDAAAHRAELMSWWPVSSSLANQSLNPSLGLHMLSIRRCVRVTRLCAIPSRECSTFSVEIVERSEAWVSSSWGAEEERWVMTGLNLDEHIDNWLHWDCIRTREARLHINS